MSGLSNRQEDEAMTKRDKAALVTLYLKTINPHLTLKEIEYGQKLFASPEHKRVSDDFGYSHKESSVFCKTIQKALDIHTAGHVLSPDMLYSYLLVEYLLWNEENTSSSALRVENLSSKKTIDQAFESSNPTNGTSEKKIESRKKLAKAIRNIKAQMTEHTNFSFDSELIKSTLRQSLYAPTAIEIPSDPSKESTISIFRKSLKAIEYNQSAINNSMHKREYLSLLHYCKTLLLITGTDEYMTPEQLLSQSLEDDLSDLENIEKNWTAIVKREAFLFCNTLKCKNSLRIIRSREPDPERDRLVGAHIERKAQIIEQLNNIGGAAPRKRKIVHQINRYYVILYKSRTVLAIEDDRNELASILSNSVSNGFLSFMIDEIDLIASDEINLVASLSDLNGDYQKGNIGINISHALERSFSSTPSKDKGSQAQLSNCHSSSAKDGMPFGNLRPSVEKRMHSSASSQRALTYAHGGTSHSSFNCSGNMAQSPRMVFSETNENQPSIYFYRFCLEKASHIKRLPAYAICLISGIIIASSSHFSYVEKDMNESRTAASTIPARTAALELSSSQDKSSAGDTLAKDDMHRDWEYRKSRQQLKIVEGNPKAQSTELPILDIKHTSIEELSVSYEAYTATWYGDELEGEITASGDIFEPEEPTIAHPSLPFGSSVNLKSKLTNHYIRATVNDRTPPGKGHHIILSQAVADALEIDIEGVSDVFLAPLSSIPIQ